MNTAFIYVPRGMQAETAAMLAASLQTIKVVGETFGQTGFDLVNFPALEEVVAPVQAVIDTIHPGARLRLERSSCRRQPADGSGKLELHQDVEAMTVDGSAAKGLVVWFPLCEIDEYTPSLDVSPLLPDRALPHHRDEHIYSIMTEPPGLPLLTFTTMALGDYVVMTPLTIHRSGVRPWHTKPRISLDLRFIAP